jgi:hypothetical protein
MQADNQVGILAKQTHRGTSADLRSTWAEQSERQFGTAMKDDDLQKGAAEGHSGWSMTAGAAGGIAVVLPSPPR